MRFFSAASSFSENWPKSFWTNIFWSFRKMFLLTPTFGTFSREPDLKWKLKYLFRFRPGPFSSIHDSGLQRKENLIVKGYTGVEIGVCWYLTSWHGSSFDTYLPCSSMWWLSGILISTTSQRPWVAVFPTLPSNSHVYMFAIGQGDLLKDCVNANLFLQILLGNPDMD